MDLNVSRDQTRPTIFYIFGASGDLTSRKLIPALYNLFLDGWLPLNFAIVGLGRTSYSDDEYRGILQEAVSRFSRKRDTPPRWDDFASHLHYIVSDISDDAGYRGQVQQISSFRESWGADPCVIFYLAVAPRFFGAIADRLSAHGLTADRTRSRVVIEKPFGRDLASAQELNRLFQNVFSEQQIYRIDHYLGKETVQNILAFRFANSILEPLWNRNYIDHVEISVTEKLGVENRGAYYEEAGALRDMVQNHILQLLCLVAMEPPVNFDADEIRNRKVDVLHAIRKFTAEDVSKNAVRGQYGRGWFSGEEVNGYREEKGVHHDSNTETYAALKLFIDNWRWHGIPFYLRTGKRMPQSSSVITVQFKDVPHMIFPSGSIEGWQQNRLIISIQPEMSIRLQMQVKRPGLQMVLNTVDMVFDYDGTYNGDTPEAYETLLLDTMLGDQTLFMRADQVEAAWDLLMPIITAWSGKKSLNFPNYAANSWGPELAESLIARDGFHWFTLPFKQRK